MPITVTQRHRNVQDPLIRATIQTVDDLTRHGRREAIRATRKKTGGLALSIRQVPARARGAVVEGAIESDLYTTGRRRWQRWQLDAMGWQHTNHRGGSRYVDSAKNRRLLRVGRQYPRVPGTNSDDRAMRAMQTRLRSNRAQYRQVLAREVNRG